MSGPQDPNEQLFPCAATASLVVTCSSDTLALTSALLLQAHGATALVILGM